ncbi:efflux RND transporter periplasmic adaptor subunit [Sunxiuqinia sp. A32]|uniref:efflux RND transporter periplasmic adaptor subunit n=1 Tax=Sunxiuqinia sp. A32 TaxID=3461496 RepID=UPI0040457516
MKASSTICLIFAATLFTLISCSNKGNEPKAETIKFVKVETINTSASQNKLVFNGKIKERSLTSLSFRVGGPIAELNVQPGDYVVAGQVIASIDNRDYELQVASTKAQWQQLQGEYNRYKQLVEQDKIPENTFEKIESGYLMAKTRYDNALNQLKDTELKAPFSGYIYEKFTENHQTVGAGTPIVSIIDISQLEVVVSVPENLLQKVKSDKTSFLDVKNAQVSQLPIQLTSVSEKTMKDGMYEVKFSFANNEKLKIAPGMTAEVSLIGDAQNSILTIPSSAVFHEVSNNYVWVFNSSTQKIGKQQIEIGALRSGGRIEVTSGLKSGDQIVTAGVHSVTDGQKVRPIAPQTATNVGGLL